MTPGVLLAHIVSRSTTDGGPSILQVMGTAVSGRSHLLGRVAQELSARGFATIAARGYLGYGSSQRVLADLGGAVAAVIDARHREAVELGVRDVLRQLDRALRLFAEPDLAEAEAVTAPALKGALSSRRWALLIDDAHMIEEPSWSFLHMLHRVLGDAGPGVVVVTTDEADLRLLGPVERLLLTSPDSAERPSILAAMGVPAELATAGGAVLPGGTTLRHLWLIAQEVAGHGDLTRAMTGLHDIAALAARRLSRLTDAEQEVLEVACVSDSGVNFWRLQRLGAIYSREEVQRLTDGLEARGILRRTFPAGRMHLAFRHEEERRAVYDRMDDLKRRLMHARMAEVVEADDLPAEERLAEVGHHLMRSGDQLAGAEKLIRAAQKLLDRGRIEESRRLFQEVASHGEAERALRLERLHALEGLADVRRHAGGPAEGGEVYRELLDEGRDIQSRSDRLRLTRKLTRSLESEGRHSEVESFIASALQEAGESAPAEEARLARVSAQIARQHGDLAGAAAHIQRGLEIASRCGDERVRAQLHLGRASLLEAKGALHEARDEYGRARDLSAEAGDPSGLATALNGLGIAHSALGQRDRAVACYRESLRLHERLGDRSAAAIAINNLATELMSAERLDEAEEALKRCLAINLELGYREGACIAQVNLASLAASRNRYEDSLRLAEEAARMGQEAGHAVTSMAAALTRLGAHLALGRLREALDDLDEVRSKVTAESQHHVWCQSVEAQCLGALGELDRAEAINMAALARCQEQGFAESEMGCLDQLVELEMVRGNLARARAHLEKRRLRSPETEGARRSVEASELLLRLKENPRWAMTPEARSALDWLMLARDPELQARVSLAFADALPAAEAYPHAHRAYDTFARLCRREDLWRAARRLGEVERELGQPDAEAHLDEAARIVLGIASELREDDRDRYLASHGRRKALLGAARLE